MRLIEIKKNKFNVTLDLKYATKDNILGKKIFKENRCFLLEAAAAKCSIVTTNTIGCREAIIHDKTGILVKLKNVKSLTAAVETLILNKKLRGEYSLNGEALAIKNYSIENVLQETFKVYDQLLFDKT